MEEKHDFHLLGLYVPVEVFLNKKLSRTDIVLFGLIKGYDNSRTHCSASNGFLAALLDVSSNTISKSIKTLIEQGLIDLVGFDGRNRVIKISDRGERIR